MAYLARVSYTGNGSTTQYSLPFSYIATSHIKAYLDNVETAAFTVSGSTLTFTSAPANSVAILIKRVTPTDARLVDFQDGSVLTEADLDQSADQNFYIAQESSDDNQSTMSLNNADVFDAQSKRIINVADPTGTQDAVSKNYLESTWLSSSDKTNINTLAPQAAKIALLGTADAIADMNTLATADVVSDLNTLANSDIVADLNTLAASDIVDDMNTLATSANVTAMGLLGTSANVTAMGLLGTSDAVADMALLGTSAVVTDLDLLGTSANVTAMGHLGTSANVTAMGLLGTSDVVADMALLGTADVIADLNTLATADVVADMNTLATADVVADMNTLATADNVANMNTVADNLAGVNSFADRYRVSSSAPSSSLDVGDLYFDTTANELKVYKSSGWAAAGSTVNGTSARYTYTISGTPNSVTGSDDNGNTLAYDAGYADVYLNGVRLSSADITITSGTTVVFASNLTNADVVDIVAYGTFNVASVNAANIDAGTLNNARLSSDVTQNTATQTLTNKTINGSNNTISNVPNSALVGTGAITINGSAVALGGSVTVGETKPTISSLTPSIITNDATNVVIAGGNFSAIPRVHAINTATGIWYEASTVTFTSATSITANFTLSVDSSNYRVRVENPDGNSVISAADALNVSDAPSWTTSAGSLGTVAGNFSGTVATVAATGDTPITFTEVSSPLVLTNASSANCALSTGGVITTSDFGGSSTSATLYTFTIRATDTDGQTSDRTFTLQSSFGLTQGMVFGHS